MLMLKKSRWCSSRGERERDVFCGGMSCMHLCIDACMYEIYTCIISMIYDRMASCKLQ